jgi:alkylation response protein AidB-like acyl-CoA dehydrogenase
MLNLNELLDAPSDDERMIAASAADFHAPEHAMRRVREHRGVVPGYGADRWRQLAELGWTSLPLPTQWGGGDGTLAQRIALVEQAGRALAPEPLVAVWLAAEVLAAGHNAALQASWLPRVARGEATLALAWQETGRGQDLAPQQVQALPVSGEDALRLNGRKVFIPQAGAADAFIVSAQAAQGDALYLVPRDAPGLQLLQRPRVDGGFWCELVLHDVRLSPADCVASGTAAPAALAQALDRARLAVSAELVGLMARALEISVAHIATREQFGQPIGAFQALQHRAVDQLVQLELARSVLLHSARVFDGEADAARCAMAASQTKARCSDAALTVTKACIQLHGGMGYTDEADIGLYLKRAMVLSAWLGDADLHRTRWAALKAQGLGIAAPDEQADGDMAEVRHWLEANFPHTLRFPAHRLDASATADWQRLLHAKGWVAPNWPKAFGGMGLSAYQQVRFQEECDRVGMNIAPNLGASMLGPLLIQYGSEAQRREHLPRILSGEVRWCQGYSEPGAGSDLANLRTQAVLEGEHFVVNGQKIWTSFAYEAQMCFLLVRTDKEAKKQSGISFLLVDMKTPGITVRRITNLTGSAEFCEVFFDNVRVPRDNLVGRLNEGWKMAKSLLGSERIMIGSPRLAQYPLRLLSEYAKAQGLDRDPVFNARFTQLELEVEDLGAAFVRMVDVLRRGRALGAEVSILKIWITETFQAVTDLILQACGESGTVDEAQPAGLHSRLHAANLYLASRAATIYGGSSEIQRNILSKMVLELPGA